MGQRKNVQTDHMLTYEERKKDLRRDIMEIEGSDIQDMMIR